MLVGLRCKCLVNRVKNPNWPEANQLAIYKCGQGFELGTTVNKLADRPGLEIGASELKVHRLENSATLSMDISLENWDLEIGG